MSRFTARPAQRGPRAFSFSYSALKNYEGCPKKYFHTSIAKDVQDELGENLAWGNAAHEALAKAARSGEPLPDGLKQYQPLLDRLMAGVGTEGVEMHAELQLAITEDFLPCEWFGEKAWFRGIVDVLKLAGSVALIADYKAGKILEDSVQLALFAQLVFSHYPAVQKVRTEFLWLKHDCTTREDFNRKDMQELWAALMPRVNALKTARETAEFPPRPSGLCRRHCPVRNCAHYGGG